MISAVISTLYRHKFNFDTLKRYLCAKETIARMLTDEHILPCIEKLTGNVLEIGSTSHRQLYKSTAVNADKYILSNFFPEKNMMKIDVQNIDFEDNSLDGIVCLNVLEHVVDPVVSVKECYRVLKKGGVLLLTVPFMFPVHAAPSDYHRFTPYQLELMTVDFSCIEIVQIGDKWITAANILQGPNWEPGCRAEYNSIFYRLQGAFYYLLSLRSGKPDNYPLFYNVIAVK